MKPNIEVHIEELVLHGFAPGDRYRIGEAVERELARLIAEREIPNALSGDVHIPRLDGGSFQTGADGKPGVAGVEIARSVHNSLFKK